LLDPVEEPFDPVAGAVEIRAKADWIVAIAFPYPGLAERKYWFGATRPTMPHAQVKKESRTHYGDRNLGDTRSSSCPDV
jgi:hypothetical protein